MRDVYTHHTPQFEFFFSFNIWVAPYRMPYLYFDECGFLY